MDQEFSWWRFLNSVGDVVVTLQTMSAVGNMKTQKRLRLLKKVSQVTLVNTNFPIR